jgi:hypothetical protein
MFPPVLLLTVGRTQISRERPELPSTLLNCDTMDWVHNDNSKPFIWTAKAADILEKVKRARTALHNRHSA